MNSISLLKGLAFIGAFFGSIESFLFALYSHALGQSILFYLLYFSFCLTWFKLTKRKKKENG